MILDLCAVQEFYLFFYHFPLVRIFFFENFSLGTVIKDGAIIKSIRVKKILQDEFLRDLNFPLLRSREEKGGIFKSFKNHVLVRDIYKPLNRMSSLIERGEVTSGLAQEFK